MPNGYKEYLLSPQRALWRTAMELKMDEYKALDMFELVPEDEVKAAGYKIMHTLWAFRIKTDTEGTFLKLNPRWCVVGTNMDRGVYQSFADVVRFPTILVLPAMRATYDLVDFQFDVNNAFQDLVSDNELLAWSTLRSKYAKLLHRLKH